jgi:hypothetical protein
MAALGLKVSHRVSDESDIQEEEEEVWSDTS